MSLSACRPHESFGLHKKELQESESGLSPKLKRLASRSSLARSQTTGTLPPKVTRAGASGLLWHAKSGPAWRFLAIAKEGLPPSMFQIFAWPSKEHVTRRLGTVTSCTLVHATS